VCEQPPAPLAAVPTEPGRPKPLQNPVSSTCYTSDTHACKQTAYAHGDAALYVLM
jgi:hypothetical protein